MPKQEGFVKKFEKLEKLVKDFEEGKIDLDKGIEKFEEWLKLAEECKKELTQLENKVTVIKGKFDEK